LYLSFLEITEINRILLPLKKHFVTFAALQNYKTMGMISVEGMEFFAYHGCFAEEQVIGTRFIVDFYFETDTSQC
jgi:hypothetical protein